MKRFPPVMPTPAPPGRSNELRPPDPVHIRRSDVRALCGALPTFVWVDDRAIAVRSGNACKQCLRLDVAGGGIGNHPKIEPAPPRPLPPAPAPRQIDPGRYREVRSALDARGPGPRIASMLLGELAAELHRKIIEPLLDQVPRPPAPAETPHDDRRGPVIDVDFVASIGPLCAIGTHDRCSGHLCACKCHAPARR